MCHLLPFEAADEHCETRRPSRILIESITQFVIWCMTEYTRLIHEILFWFASARAMRSHEEARMHAIPLKNQQETKEKAYSSTF